MTRTLSGYYNLHQVIYVSRVNRMLHASQSQYMEDILRVSIRNNKRVGVTGALLACDGWFVQLLEGRRVDVDSVLRRIENDVNHYDIRKISSLPVDRRAFPGWGMCASTLSLSDAAIVEALRGSGKFDGGKVDAKAAIRLLQAVGKLQTKDAPVAPWPVPEDGEIAPRAD